METAREKKILTFAVMLNTIACVAFALGGAFIPIKRELFFEGACVINHVSDLMMYRGILYYLVLPCDGAAECCVGHLTSMR